MRKACYFLFTLMLCSGLTLTLAGACGGDTGLTCLEGQFCKLPTGSCDASVEGVCTDIPLSCDDWFGEELPCGCDGVQYLSLCHSDLAGVSLSRPGPCDGSCSGFWGIGCLEGETCEFWWMRPPYGGCGDDGWGQCVPKPDPMECPDHCQPVCSCPGITYRTPCDARQAGYRIAHPGRCNEVHGVRFLSADRMEWESLPGATGYNVYLDGDVFAAESSGPTCQAAGLQTTTWDIPSVPDLGELWEIEVTAQESQGEGPMGMGSLCGQRQAGQSCGD